MEWRLARNDYRGFHLTQHNRLTFKKFNALLKNAKEFLKVPAGDEGKNFVLGNYVEYCNFINDFREELFEQNVKPQGTANSIKKTLFPDLARMNIIKRYNKNLLELNPYSRGNIEYIKLDNSVLKYETMDILQREEYFKIKSKELYIVMLPCLFAVLNSDKIEGWMDEYEFLFFFTWIGKKYNDEILDEIKVIDFIISYRKISRAGKKYIIEKISKWAVPKYFKGNKTIKRDFRNWKNETQDIMQNLKASGLFSLNKNANKFELLFKNLENKSIVRSKTAKEECFINHSVSKVLGFELDHSVPFSWITTYEEAIQIDNWKNLIYIDAKNHAIKSQQNNKYTYFGKGKEKNYRLYSIDGTEIKLELDKDIIFNENLYDIIYNYNKNLNDSIK